MKKFLNSFEDGICAIILFIMLILTFINVIARYVLLASMPFVEELTCVGLMVLSILGAATASKRGAHLGLSVITDLLPQTAQSAIALICDILNAAFCVVIVYLGYLMVQNQINSNVLSMGMSWPVWLYGIWLPIGGVVLFIRQVQLAIQNFIKTIHGGKEETA